MTHYTYEEIVKYLIEEVPMFGVKSGLDNIKELTERLNNPQKKLKVIHVAGTNGKGSVCKMLSTILAQAGYRVGLFTSPHIQCINERIMINNQPVTNEVFTNCYKIVNEKVEGMVNEGKQHPTFFEILFAMALVCFQKDNVDVAIIEVGIGGRLDTTNILEDTLLSIITNIGVDHVNILGDHIEMIATEKAGIIKQDGKVVYHVGDTDAARVIEEIGNKQNAKLYNVVEYSYIERKRTAKSIDFSINNKYYKYDDLNMPIVSDYQIDNVATVLTAVEILKRQYVIDESHVLKGLKNFYWPGRMEFVGQGILIDGAHNPLGMEYFVEYINKYCNSRRLTIVFSLLKTKEVADVIRIIASLNNIEEVIIYKVSNQSVSYEVLKNQFSKYGIIVKIEEQLNSIIKRYREEDELLCFVGSLYLVSEVKKLIGGNDCD